MREFFPKGQASIWEETAEVTEISADELTAAVKRKLKTRKAPGTDGIMPVKGCNKWLGYCGGDSEGMKRGKDSFGAHTCEGTGDGSSVLRPLCLIRSLGKIYEHMIRTPQTIPSTSTITTLPIVVGHIDHFIRWLSPIYIFLLISLIKVTTAQKIYIPD